MVRKLLSILFIHCIGLASIDAAPKLSDESYISLLTCSPGDHLYEAFGHSAIRVVDPVWDYDAAYNYGTFSFNRPNFYTNFAMGNLIYSLGVSSTNGFLRHYVRHGRRVDEDVLNLTQEQKQALFDYLEINRLPENKDYRYDYFYNNCATKIRDIVHEFKGPSLVFDSTHLKDELAKQLSIRELVDLYMEPQPWGDLGIDLALGLPMDKVASPYEYMYLPDYLRDGFRNAHFTRGDSVVPLVQKSILLNASEPTEIQLPFFTPIKLFWLLFMVTVLFTLVGFKSKKAIRFWDVTYFGLIGFLGLNLFFISFFTDHQAAVNNLNILWAFPLHFFAAFVIPFKNKIGWLRYYFGFSLLLTALVLIGYFTFMPQLLHYSLIPLWLGLMLRSYMLWRA